MFEIVKRHKKTSAAISAVGVLAVGGGVALALFAANAKVSGSGTSSTFAARFTDSVAPTVSGSATQTGYPQAEVNAGTLILPPSAFYPGDDEVVSARVIVDGTRSGYVSAVTMPGLSAGYRVKITEGCGSVVTTGGLGTPVTLAISRDATALTAPDWTVAAAASAGLAVTAADVPAGGVTCAEYVGK